MRIVAFDLGTKMGVALAEDGVLVQSGVEDFTRRKSMSRGEQFHQMRRWFAVMIQLVDVVAYEAVSRHRGTKAAHFYGAAEALLLAAAHEARIASVRTWTPNQIKLHAAGRGDADKAIVIRAIEDRFGIVTVDDNHADALAVLCAAMKEGK